MKKALLTAIAAAICVFFMAGCAFYSVARDVKGGYQTTELNANLLTPYIANVQEQMMFNLIKYSGVNGTFYGAKVHYVYAPREYSPGDRSFDIKPKNGVIIRVNGGRNFYPQYRGKPEFSSGTTNAVQMGSTMHGAYTMYTETVECVLTEKQIAYMATASEILVTLAGGTPNPEVDKTVMYFFTPENLKIIKQFYDEEINGK